MTTLITGATGYLGARLAARLASQGEAVHAVIRENSKKDRLRAVCPSASLHLYDGSTASLCGILQTLQPCTVYHLASMFIADHAAADVEPLVRSNVLFGTQLLEAMTFANVNNLVIAATASQNFHGDSYCPATLYAATKEAFLAIARYYVEAGHARIITLKIFDTYGPGDWRNKLIPLLIRTARTGEPLGMSPGYQLLDLVYVDDVVDAFAKAGGRLASQTGLSCEEYAISSGKRITLREVVATFECVLGQKMPVIFGERDYRAREIMDPWRGGISVPGWSPETDLEMGLRLVLQSAGLA